MSRSIEYRRERIKTSVLALFSTVITGCGIFFSMNFGHPLPIAIVTVASLSVVCIISGIVGLCSLSLIIWPPHQDNI